MAMRALLALLSAPIAAACPGSPASSMHASANLDVTFSNACDTVHAEIQARGGAANSGGPSGPLSHPLCLEFACNLMADASN